MNGFCVCLQLFWRDLATIRLSRSICRASALFMLSRGFQIHYRTVLQRVVRVIKRSQGSPSSNRLPITDSHMLLMWKSLNVHLTDHCMFWAAYTLGVLWFPRYCRVYTAQFGHLLFFNSLDCCVGYYSGWRVPTFLYACHNQSFKD